MTLNERDPHRNFTHISQQQNALPVFFGVGFFSTVGPKKKIIWKATKFKDIFYQPNFIIINRKMNIFLRWYSVTFLWHCRIYTACGKYRWLSHILSVRLVFLFLFSFLLLLLLFLLNKSNGIDIIDHEPHRTAPELCHKTEHTISNEI